MQKDSVSGRMQSIHKTPDGIMIYGPHAQTAEENKGENTISSIYIIEKDKNICIIDTGRFESRYRILKNIIEKNNYQLKYIILTHDHYDHIGNADILKKEFIPRRAHRAHRSRAEHVGRQDCGPVERRGGRTAPRARDPGAGIA